MCRRLKANRPARVPGIFEEGIRHLNHSMLNQPVIPHDQLQPKLAHSPNRKKNEKMLYVVFRINYRMCSLIINKIRTSDGLDPLGALQSAAFVVSFVSKSPESNSAGAI